MTKEKIKTVMPIISVDSVDDARQFYVEKLGFSHMMGMVGKDGKLDFCTVVLNGAKIMLMRPQEQMDGTSTSISKRPVEIYVEVDNVDEYYSQVKKRSVSSVAPMTNQWWGDRTFIVQDPYGYQIWFYQQVGEIKPPQGAKLI